MVSFYRNFQVAAAVGVVAAAGGCLLHDGILSLSGVVSVLALNLKGEGLGGIAKVIKAESLGSQRNRYLKIEVIKRGGANVRSWSKRGNVANEYSSKFYDLPKFYENSKILDNAEFFIPKLHPSKAYVDPMETLFKGVAQDDDPVPVEAGDAVEGVDYKSTPPARMPPPPTSPNAQFFKWIAKNGEPYTQTHTQQPEWVRVQLEVLEGAESVLENGGAKIQATWLVARKMVGNANVGRGEITWKVRMDPALTDSLKHVPTFPEIVDTEFDARSLKAAGTQESYVWNPRKLRVVSRRKYGWSQSQTGFLYEILKGDDVVAVFQSMLEKEVKEAMNAEKALDSFRERGSEVLILPAVYNRCCIQ